ELRDSSRVELRGLEHPSVLTLVPLYADYFISRDLLISRRQLAVCIANHVAFLSTAVLETDDKNDRTESGGSEGEGTRRRRKLSAMAIAAMGDPSASARQVSLNSSKSLKRVKALMLLTSTESVPPITPSHVIEMAHTLGIDLTGGEPEYYALWVAVDALHAPLPPLWHRVEPSDGMQSAYYEHSVTFEQLGEHPLLPVFKAQVVRERQQSKRTRAFGCFDHWMLFGGGGGSTFFFNFRTRQRHSGRKLPAEVVNKLGKMAPAKKKKTAVTLPDGPGRADSQVGTPSRQLGSHWAVLPSALPPCHRSGRASRRTRLPS
ncbi:MAG: hypothetical protein SGPRY_013992, partial [Prymnesium sp.]